MLLLPWRQCRSKSHYDCFPPRPALGWVCVLVWLPSLSSSCLSTVGSNGGLPPSGHYCSAVAALHCRLRIEFAEFVLVFACHFLSYIVPSVDLCTLNWLPTGGWAGLMVLPSLDSPMPHCSVGRMHSVRSPCNCSPLPQHSHRGPAVCLSVS